MESEQNANPVQTTALFGVEKGVAGNVLTPETPCSVGWSTESGADHLQFYSDSGRVFRLTYG